MRLAYCRRGMSTLQAVLMLGGAFVVVWGLMSVWQGVQNPLQTQVERTLRGEPGDSVGKNPDVEDNPPTVEPPDTRFDVPGYGPLTDDEIGEKQWWADARWGGSAHLPFGVDADAVRDAAFGDVYKRAVDFAGNNGKTPGEANALQHAYWQAQLAFEYDSESAKAIGDQHETLQKYGNSLRKRDSVADLKNNEVGRGFGEQVRREAATAPPGFDPYKRMRDLILQAVRDRRLDIGGGLGGHGGSGIRKY